MKTSLKLRLIALIPLLIGVAMIVIGVSAFEVGSGGFVGLISAGVMVSFIALPLFIVSLMPTIAKTSADLNSESLELAGEKISENLEKGADVINPAISKVTKTIKGAVNDKEAELRNAKKLFDEGLIDEEEYQKVKNKILGI